MGSHKPLGIRTSTLVLKMPSTGPCVAPSRAPQDTAKIPSHLTTVLTAHLSAPLTSKRHSNTTHTGTSPYAGAMPYEHTHYRRLIDLLLYEITDMWARLNCAPALSPQRTVRSLQIDVARRPVDVCSPVCV
jgi:hypothetical protein